MYKFLVACALLSAPSLGHAQFSADLVSATELQVTAAGQTLSVPAGKPLFDDFNLTVSNGNSTGGLEIELTETSTEFVYEQVDRMVGRAGSTASFGLLGGFMPHATSLTLSSATPMTGRLEIAWDEDGFYPQAWDLGARVDVDNDGSTEFFVDSVTGQTGVSGSTSLPLTVGPSGRVVLLETWGWMVADPLPGFSGISGFTTIRFVPDQCDITEIYAGCGPILTVDESLDSTLDFQLSGVPTTLKSFGYLLIGNQINPISMGNGCSLVVSPKVRLAMVSDNNGGASLSLPIGLPGQTISVQGGTYDGASGAALLANAYEITCL